MQDDRHPDIFRFHIGKGKENPQRHAGDDLRRCHNQPFVRCHIIEEITRQMPKSPHDAKNQNTSSDSEPLLQDRLQIITPSIFLTKERRKRQDEIHRHEQKITPGFRSGQGLHEKACLPGQRVRYACPPKIQQQKQKDTEQGRFPVPPPKPAGFSPPLTVQQKRDPAQKTSADQDELLHQRPQGKFASRKLYDRFRRQHGQDSQNGHQNRHQKKNPVKPSGQLPLSSFCQRIRQHHSRRRIHHLCIGKSAQSQGSRTAVPHQNSHQVSNAIGYEQKNKKLLSFYICFRHLIHSSRIL